jgi:PhoH-like ATPase
LSKESINVKDLASKIEVIPLAFIRGRSFTNSIVIVDEAESMDLNALKTVLTRIDR